MGKHFSCRLVLLDLFQFIQKGCGCVRLRRGFCTVTTVIIACSTILLLWPGDEGWKWMRDIADHTTPRSCPWRISLELNHTTLSSELFSCPWRKECKGCTCYDPKKNYKEKAPSSNSWLLPEATDLEPSDDSIFFGDVTCPSTEEEEQGVFLTFRQACAVESAALLHPKRSIFLLVVSPTVLSRDPVAWTEPASVLFNYSNVQVVRVSMKKFVHGTPLEPLFAAGALARGKWPLTQASDLMRFLTLWRFGGTYLDLDFIITKPLDELRNFAVSEEHGKLTAGAMSFACDELGRHLAWQCVRELRETYHCDDWGHNGAGVITRVLQRFCQTNSTKRLTMRAGCRGFTVLPPEDFYPVPWQQWERLVDKRDISLTMAAVKDSYAIQTWHRWSSAKEVFLKSEQPYAQVARRFCPIAVATAGNTF